MKLRIVDNVCETIVNSGIKRAIIREMFQKDGNHKIWKSHTAYQFTSEIYILNNKARGSKFRERNVKFGLRTK
jgi:hypothetical protein